MKKNLYLCFAASMAMAALSAAAPRAKNAGPANTGGTAVLSTPTTIHYVTTSGTSGNSGLTWAAATDLQTALTKAAAGEQIWIAKGTYIPTAVPPKAAYANNITDSKDYCFQAVNAVNIYGNFAGTETTLSQRSLSAANETILSGNNTSYRVFVAIGTNAPALIDGMVFSDATPLYSKNATISTFAINSNYGAAIAVQSASPAISNCKFRNNGCGYGALFFKSSTSTLTNCTFANNSALYNGGAIYNSSGNPVITNCLFSGNTSTTSGGQGGGGICNSASNPTITNCTFVNNKSNAGGAIYDLTTNTSNPKIYNCIVWNNISSSGGPAINGATLTVNNTLSQEILAGTGNISSGPRFASATSFSLTNCSPAINAGNNTYISASTDLAGNTRIQNTTVDMGAYESAFAVATSSNWTGAASTDWAAAANWSCAFVPAGTDNVAIPATANQPALSAAQSVNNLSLTGNTKIMLGDNNLTVASITGASATAYFVTNGAGALTITNVPTTGATLPIGASASSYDPVTVTPATASGFSALVKATMTASDFAGNIGDYNKVAPRQWTVTPTVLPGPASAVLAFTNGAANFTPTPTSSARVGHYTGSAWVELSANYSANKWTATTPSFSPFSVGTAGGALPVELLYFSAKNAGSANLVSWQTASEKNNLRFDVERSADGQTFGFLGSVKGQNQAAQYAFTDSDPFRLTYYRLRQIDFDGAESFSKIVVVTAGAGASGKLRVYPSPTSALLNVENPAAGAFSVLDVMGRVILTGAAVPQIDVSALPAGIYILKTETDQVKFVKQ